MVQSGRLLELMTAEQREAHVEFLVASLENYQAADTSGVLLLVFDAHHACNYGGNVNAPAAIKALREIADAIEQSIG